MSTVLKNTIIPLYINSADRDNASDPTSNFTISLRKSLRNISSLNVSNVVIPRSDTEININNNTLQGSVNIDGTLTEFTVVLTNGNYTGITLADELQAQLDSNEITAIFGFTWDVIFNDVTGRLELTLFYTRGALLNSWGIDFLYTPLVDIIGIGGAGTTTREFLTSFSDSLIIDIERAPTLQRPLWFNITSKALTQGIDTSYIQSLGKSFNINGSNNTIAINVNQDVNNQCYQLETYTGASLKNEQGNAISISGDGNIIAVSAIGGVFIYTRTLEGGFWIQRVPIVRPNNSDPNVSIDVTSVDLSRDGNVLVVGLSNVFNFEGSVWIFTRSGLEWNQKQKLQGTGIPTTPNNNRQGSAVSLSEDGTIVVIGGFGDDTEAGAVWTFVGDGMTWSEDSLKLTGPGSVGSSKFGTSTSLSADGNTLAVGGPADNSNIGAVWIFTRVGSSWVQQGPKLIGTGIIGTSFQGDSVALSVDGNTLAIGGPSDDSNVGATWVFTRTGSVWSQQGPKLVGVGLGSNPSQGDSVALSADGNTLAVGAPFDGSGSIVIFTRTGSVWSQQGSPLEGSGGIGGIQLQGKSVDLSSDGNIVTFGAPNEDSKIGASWIFERDTGIWSQVGNKLVGSNQPGQSEFGYSVDISADGSTMAIGGPRDDPDGAAWVYTREGVIWKQQGLKLVYPNPFPGGSQGTAVSLSADGNTLAVGCPKFPYDDDDNGFVAVYNRVGSTWSAYGSQLIGTGSVGNGIQGVSTAISADGSTIVTGSPFDDGGIGAVWVFTLIGNSWVQQGPKLVGTGGIIASLQGTSVSLSADGNTLAVGGPGDNNEIGATWVFVRTGSVWTQQGPVLKITGPQPKRKQGQSVDLSDDGNTLIVGAPGRIVVAGSSVVGSILTYQRTGTAWTLEKIVIEATPTEFGTSVSITGNGSRLAVSSSEVVSVYDRDGIDWVLRAEGSEFPVVDTTGSAGSNLSISSDGTSFAYGLPEFNSNEGAVKWFVLEGNFDNQYEVSIVPKVYTIFDLVNYLEDAMGLSETLTITPVFDGNNIVTLTLTTPENISATFTIDKSSTFEFIRWVSEVYSTVQVSIPIDMTINNNVIKTIPDHQFHVDSVIVDDNRSIVFRKYQAGFTLDVDIPIDIQLRDERDRIIDLNGSNWVMVVFAEIHT